MTLSGPVWLSKFPNSNHLTDLAEPFRTKATNFVAALQSAGAAVHVTATLRPPQRAYLMHFSFAIAMEGLDPATVPPKHGVDIQWVHRDSAGEVDLAASKEAAQEMVSGYGIVFKPALTSRHIEARAVDMDITWHGDLVVTMNDGSHHTISSVPRNGADNTDLHSVGALFGVFKLATDAPHWSDDGH